MPSVFDPNDPLTDNLAILRQPCWNRALSTAGINSRTSVGVKTALEAGIGTVGSLNPILDALGTAPPEGATYEETIQFIVDRLDDVTSYLNAVSTGLDQAPSPTPSTLKEAADANVVAAQNADNARGGCDTVSGLDTGTTSMRVAWGTYKDAAATLQTAVDNCRAATDENLGGTTVYEAAALCVEAYGTSLWEDASGTIRAWLGAQAPYVALVPTWQTAKVADLWPTMVGGTWAL